MILNFLNLLVCLIVHRYEAGRFFNPNIQFFEFGKRCQVCGHTVIEK